MQGERLMGVSIHLLIFIVVVVVVVAAVVGEYWLKKGFTGEKQCECSLRKGRKRKSRGEGPLYPHDSPQHAILYTESC